MNRKLFYAILDELAEVWYIDSSKIMFEETKRAGKTRALRYRDIPAEDMLKAIADNEPNTTGFPIVEIGRAHV